MAEIKSTMEMVLARAERLAAEAVSTDKDEIVKKGMRIAADYLKNQNADLRQELQKQLSEEQHEIRKGMAEVLLRNIILPRDEELKSSGHFALQAILQLGDKNSELQVICQELAQILDQYSQHKQQTTQQFEDAIRAQLEQQQMMSGQEAAPESINPAMHPQYREELSKTLTSLNNQYTEAMDQRKSALANLFS